MAKLQLQKAKNFWFLKAEADYLERLMRHKGEKLYYDRPEVRIPMWHLDPNKRVWDSHEKAYVKKWEKIEVVTEGHRANLKWLVKEAYTIRVALTNIAYTAKRLPKEYSSKEKMRMCLVGNRFNSLVFLQEEGGATLEKIALACQSMSARCMKAYRKTKAPCCKRYYSLFRALEQQAERLEDRLHEWVTT